MAFPAITAAVRKESVLVVLLSLLVASEANAAKEIHLIIRDLFVV